MRCLLALLCLAAPLTAQSPTPFQPTQQHAPTAPLRLDAADALGAGLFAKSGSTGMVMVVVRGHEILFRGYGETFPGSHQKPDEHSLIRLCSLSKIFATDLLTRLVKDGTVSLDDPLQKFAPPRALVPERDHTPITLLSLATHTSGLPREIGPAPRGTPHFTFPGWHLRWAWLPRAHLASAPGQIAAYSNLGFDFLGDALEHAAREPYARLFAERISAPLALTETGFTPNPAQCARLLRGAHDEGPCTDTQSSAASAGVYSTASDITRWLQYLLGGNPTATPAIPAQDPAAQNVYLLPAQLLRQQGLDHSGDVTGIGLGWMHLADGTPSELIQKTGGGAGFTTYIALSHPQNTAIFVAFTDSATPTHDNVFKGANNLVYALNGLPLMPEEIVHLLTPPRRTAARPRAAHHSAPATKKASRPPANRRPRRS